MPVESMCIAAEEGGPTEMRDAVDVVAGQGIRGDRNYGRSKNPGQNLTLIEAEEIDRFNAEHGLRVPYDGPRRNVVTRGDRLNELVGREFMLGEVRFRGVELCEPCAVLGRWLETEDTAAKDVVRAFVHRGGLRCDALTSGTVRLGDAIRALDD